MFRYLQSRMRGTSTVGPGAPPPGLIDTVIPVFIGKLVTLMGSVDREAALDSEVELAIQEQLLGLVQGKTVIAVAHRLSTIARMNRLIVLEAGRVVEQGTHVELLRLGRHYAKLWRHQSSGFPVPDLVAGELLTNYPMSRRPTKCAPTPNPGLPPTARRSRRGREARSAARFRSLRTGEKRPCNVRITQALLVDRCWSLVTEQSDLDHLEVALAGAAIGAGPGLRHIRPARARGYALLR